MRYVSLGGLRASVIGLGAWQFTNAGWGWGTEFGPAEARQIVQRALELGINLIDTAESYSDGESERMVGEAVRERRADVLLATKVSANHATQTGVERAARRSLERLGVDSVDLYQVHWHNFLIPAGWTMAGMRELRAQGLVREVGVSNYPVRRWQEAEAALGAPIASNQVHYNLLERFVERRVLPHAQSNDRAIIAFSPLAMGMLSGRYTPDNLPRGAREINPLFRPENAERVQPVIDVLREVAEAHGATPAQIALAWLLSHSNVIAIPEAKSIAQVEANAAAADIELRPDETNALNAVSEGFEPVGPPRVVAPSERSVYFE